MINTPSLSIVNAARFTPQFKRPLYHSYAYSLIPNTVIKLFTQEALEALPVEAVGGEWAKQDIVIVLLIDGFGWCFFEEFRSQFPFLARFETQGVASKISSQFPSTTAAHVTTICTGMEVGQTGIYEWFQYEPIVDAMISPLLYSFAGDHQPSALSRNGFAPDVLFPFPTLYQSLAKRRISSYIVQQESIINTPYSRAMYKGAELVSYRSFREGLKKALDICQSSKKEPAYIFVYLGDIDAAGHRHGEKSEAFHNAVVACWTALEESFFQPLASCNKRIATIVTADHGMAGVDPRTTLYLNKEFPDLIESFKTNTQGKPLVPAGSCRDFFLHIREDALTSVHDSLQEQLKGKAEIYYVKDLIDQGFFGAASISKRFANRVGNLVVLPYLNESIWWYEKHRFEQHFYAAHGGLTPNESESIFLYAETR